MRYHIFCLLLCLSISAKAQIVTDRPDQTESSSTVGKGVLQIESGLFIGYEGGESASTQQILAPTTLFRYGLTQGIELRVVNQFESLKHPNGQSIFGISDIEVGTKVQLLQSEEWNTEIAFLTHVALPTGTSELSSDTAASISKLSIAHALGDNLDLGYNIGYNYFGTGSGDLTYSVALGVGVTDNVGIYIEPYGDVVNLEEGLHNIDAGVTYLPHKNLQFDFSFGLGLNYTMNYMAIGFSWRTP